MSYKETLGKLNNKDNYRRESYQNKIRYSKSENDIWGEDLNTLSSSKLDLLAKQKATNDWKNNSIKRWEEEAPKRKLFQDELSYTDPIGYQEYQKGGEVRYNDYLRYKEKENNKIRSANENINKLSSETNDTNSISSAIGPKTSNSAGGAIVDVAKPIQSKNLTSKYELDDLIKNNYSKATVIKKYDKNSYLMEDVNGKEFKVNINSKTKPKLDENGALVLKEDSYGNTTPKMPFISDLGAALPNVKNSIGFSAEMTPIKASKITIQNNYDKGKITKDEYDEMMNKINSIDDSTTTKYSEKAKEIEKDYSTLNENDGAISSIGKNVLQRGGNLMLYANPVTRGLAYASDTGTNALDGINNRNLDSDEAFKYGNKEAMINAITGPMQFGSGMKDVLIGAGIDSVSSNATDYLIKDKDGNDIGAKTPTEFLDRAKNQFLVQAGVGTVLQSPRLVLKGTNAINDKINTKNAFSDDNIDSQKLNDFSMRNVDSNKNTSTITYGNKNLRDIISQMESKKNYYGDSDNGIDYKIDKNAINKTYDELKAENNGSPKNTNVNELETLKGTYDDNRSVVLDYMKENNVDVNKAQQDLGIDLVRIEDNIDNVKENNPQIMEYRKVKAEYDNAKTQIIKTMEDNNLSIKNPTDVAKAEEITGLNLKDIQGRLINAENNIIDFDNRLTKSENTTLNKSKSEIIGTKDDFDKASLRNLLYKEDNKITSSNPIKRSIINDNSVIESPNNKMVNSVSKINDLSENNSLIVGDNISYNNKNGIVLGFDTDGKIIAKDTDGKIEAINNNDLNIAEQEVFFKENKNGKSKIEKLNSLTDEEKSNIDFMSDELGLITNKADGYNSGYINKNMESLKKDIYDLDQKIINAEKNGINTEELKRNKANLIKEFNSESKKIETNKEYSLSKTVGVDENGKTINEFKSDNEKYLFQRSDLEQSNAPIEKIRENLLKIDNDIKNSFSNGKNTEELFTKREELLNKFIELKDSIEDRSQYIAKEQLEASRDEYGNIKIGDFFHSDEAKGNVFKQVGFKKGLVELWNYAYKTMVSSNNKLEKVSSKSANMKNALNNTDKKVQFRLNNLKDIMSEVPTQKKEAINFYNYIVHKRNITTAADGKPVARKISPEISMEEVARYEKENPTFKKIADNLSTKLVSELHDILVGSGTMSEKNWAKVISKNSDGVKGFYMPLERIVDEIILINEPWGKLKGNYKGDYLDVIESYINVIERSVKYAEANRVGQELLKDVVSGKTDGIARVVKSSDRIKDGENIFKVRQNGEIIQIAIKDKELFGELTNMYNKSNGKNLSNSEFINAFLKQSGDVVNWCSKFVTKGLTEYNPGFGLMNGVKDFNRYIKYTSEKNFGKSILMYLKAMGDISKDRVVKTINDTFKTNLKRSENLISFEENGGRAGNYFSNIDSPDVARELTKQELDPKSFKNSRTYRVYRGTTSPIRLLGKVISTINNDIETIPRYAENLNTIKKGGTKIDGVLSAREITGNFSRSGTLGKQINKVYPFFNATIQGLDKFGRTMKDTGKRNQLLKKSLYQKGVMTTLGLISASLFSEDKNEANVEYDKLDNRTKDNNFNIYIGDGKFAKIPKSIDTDMFITLAERLYRAVDSKDPQVFTDGLGSTLKEAYMPPIDPRRSALVSPYFDLEKNKDFLNRDIIPSYMEGWENKNKYTESTTEMSKFLGNKLNLSPIQIDFVLNNYFGVRYSPVQNYTKGENIGETLKETTNATFDKVIKRRFVADTKYNNKYSQDYYNDKKLISNAKSTLTSHTKSSELKGNDKKRYNDLSDMESKYSDMNKEIQELYDKISKTKDKAKIDALQLQITNKKMKFMEQYGDKINKLK